MFSSMKRRLIAAASTVATAALVVAGLAFAPLAASADAPPPTLPQTVGADVLTSPQINGVVWNVAVSGTTAYAVGSFTAARPSGSAPGVNEVTRNNAMAYNILTGAILPWNPNLSAQATSVKVSPDGTKLYVGGNFNTVGGTSQSKIVAFDLPSGNRDPNFQPSVNGTVVGIAVSNTTVYAGGSFLQAGGQSRTNLAAFTRSTGAVTAWAPTADDIVEALVVSPDSSRVVIGGRFQNMNGQGIVGIGAVDGTVGATQTWTSRPIPTAQGASARSWTTDLLLKDGVVYGTADGEGGHWFDGRFAADFATGNLSWLDNCYGATYGTQVIGQVVYFVDHSHDCLSVNTFPQQNPTVWMRATADTIYPTGFDQQPPGANSNYSGQPIPTQLNWYPAVNTGNYTGAFQGGWSLGSDGSKYLVMGGEFTTVNGIAQQGLATFATRDTAPNKVGPQYRTTLQPSVLSLSNGTARVAFTGTSDPDDAVLTYQVLRDNSLTPIYSVDSNSQWWALPQLGYVDSGLVPGSSHTYRIQVKDPWGNSTIGPRSAAVVISSASPSAYTQMIGADGASTYWPLNEASGTVVYDNVGFNDADAGTAVTRNVPGAIPNDAASNFTGSDSSTIATRTAITGPNVFTIEAWIKTTSTTGGKIMGFGNVQTGSSSNYDRHIYMDGAGRITFGVYPGGVATVTSKPGFNDGNWHLIAASLGPDGMKLYMDGARVAQRSDVTTAQGYSGYWRVGGDNQNGWPNTGSSQDFTGTIDNVAIYPTVISPTTELNHWTSTGRTSTIPSAPADAYGKLVYQDNPDLYWRLDDTTGSVAKDAGVTGNDGLISGTVTKNQSGALAGGIGKSFAFDGSSGMVAASNQASNPTAYTEEVWFNTTTHVGGKLIGFGDQQTGLSSNYDRHVYMQNDGTLAFGAWTGQTNLAISPLAYNDGNWHQVVASQGSDGMKLYVDGALVATNPQTQAQGYSGYWRIGGDNTWSSSSPWFNGKLDEASVYSSVLPASRILAHYQAGAGIVANQPPVASFTSSHTDLTATFDASASSDPEGSTLTYSWDFGDGSAAGTGVNPSHTYGSAGNYNVILTVKDTSNATNSVTHQVTVTAPNQPPTAAFSATPTNLTVAFDGTASSDPEGPVASYAWDFGDGTTGTGATPSHTYATANTYTVSLTVKDGVGASSAPVTHPVTVTAPANQPPVAAFSSTSAGLVASFNGSASSDPEGATLTYSWDFGDGSAAGTGATPSHTYAASGNYNVTLTVTDDKAATGAVSHQVTVNSVVVLAQDAFGRNVTNGWGTADVGGAWSTVSTASNFVVNGIGYIKMANPGSGPAIYLSGVSSTDTQVLVSVGLDKAPTGGGVTTSVIARGAGTTGDYRAKVMFLANGTVSLGLTRTDSTGAQTTLAADTVIAGLTYTVGDQLNIKVQAYGTSPTTLNARVWKNGTTEPATWQRTATDSTAALQVAGRIGFFSYNSSSSTNAPIQSLWDNLVATKTGN